jgi:hypothetical protein
VVHVFELWSESSMTKSEMDGILDVSEKAHWPSDWFERFRSRRLDGGR